MTEAPPEVLAAAERLEDEMGLWGSISMRLGDDHLADIRALIKFARGQSGADNLIPVRSIKLSDGLQGLDD